MEKKYSFKIGFFKVLIGIVSGVLLFLTFAGLSDLTIWGLLEMYLKPVLGTLSVAGVFAGLLNALKFKASKLEAPKTE